jgi:cell division protein FtsW
VIRRSVADRMGDRRRLGTDPLVRRGPFDAVAAFATLALMGIGGVMVLSASALSDFARTADPFATALPQTLWIFCAIAVLFVASRCSPTLLYRIALPLYVAAVVGLLLVLVPGIGIEVGGSARWLRLAPGLPTIHPAELAKPAVVLFLAALFTDGRVDPRSSRGLLVFATVAGLPLLLTLLEPDLGTGSVIGVAALVTYFAAGGSLRHLIPAAAGAVLLAALFLSINEYQAARIHTWLDPWSDPQGAGFHTIQGLIAIARGGLTGVGLGQGEQAASLYLPNADNDYIYAVIAEETGLLGALAVSLLFLLFIGRGLQIASRASDRFGSVAAAGISGAIGFQAFANIGVVTGLIPVTGIPLPFVSAGGSSLLVLAGAAGLLLAVSREQLPARASSLQPTTLRRSAPRTLAVRRSR